MEHYLGFLLILTENTKFGFIGTIENKKYELTLIIAFMIIIFEQDLTHYRASFYDFFADFIAEEILIVYGTGEPKSAHLLEGGNKRKFKTLKIKRKWIGKSFYLQSIGKVLDIIKTQKVSCIIDRGAIRNLGLYWEIKQFQKQGVPVILRGIGFSVKRDFNPRKNIFDFFYKRIVNQSDAFLCYTKESKTLMDQHYNPNKIFIGINTLNSQLLNDHYKQLERTGKEILKKELNLTKKNYLIHVGRLSQRKKIHEIIDIYAYLKGLGKDIGLILIGDGPKKEDLKEFAKQKKLEDILFIGALSSENILTSKYIYCSDVFVITGNIGLSVNHAFFFGKPVVGYVIEKGEKRPKNYLHGPEKDYLIDGYNGLTVQDNDAPSFSNAIIKLLENKKYGINAYNYAQSFLTVEKMALGYIEAINYVISKNKK